MKSLAFKDSNDKYVLNSKSIINQVTKKNNVWRAYLLKRGNDFLF